MAFEQTWRWFGPYDPYSLEDAKQTGITGIVSALHQIPIGDIWKIDEILKRKKKLRNLDLHGQLMRVSQCMKILSRERGII